MDKYSPDTVLLFGAAHVDGKHTEAAAVKIIFHAARKNLMAEVTDNGKGFNYRRKVGGSGRTSLSWTFPCAPPGAMRRRSDGDAPASRPGRGFIAPSPTGMNDVEATNGPACFATRPLISKAARIEEKRRDVDAFYNLLKADKL